MLIGTMEALDRVQVGAQVKVSGEVWERTSEGFRKDKEALPLIAFKGFAEDKLVRTSDDLGLTFPSWWTDGSYVYLALAEDPVTGGILMPRFHREQYNAVVYLPEASIRNMRNAAPSPFSAATWMAALTGVANLLTPDRGMVATGSPQDLIADLHALCPTAEGLDDLLTTHGIGRVRKGTVSVQGSGTAKVPSGLFGPDVEVEQKLVVGWKVAYSYEAVAPLSETCLCTTFDEETHQARLPEGVVTAEYATVCSEEDCGNRPAEKSKRARS